MFGIFVFGYVIAGIITATVIYNVCDWEEWHEDDMISFVGLAGLLWWVTLTVAATYGVIKSPHLVRQLQENRGERKRQKELANERHLTELAVERAKRAEAQRQELEALGLPRAHLTEPVR